MAHLLDQFFAAGHKPSDLQTERLIALLRVALTLFWLISLVAAPANHPSNPTIELILAGYTVFGLYVALLAFLGKHRLQAHIADIAVVSVLRFFLGNTSSTFFLLLYVFVLLAATVRWNWRGALCTTGFLGAMQAFIFVAVGGATEFAVEYAFLIIIGGMFAFFGASREQSRERLMDFAAWPSKPVEIDPENDGKWLEASLAHITEVLRVPRVLILWEVAQEPFLFTACYADGQCIQDRRPANIYGDLVAPELVSETFAFEAIKSFQCITASGKKLFLDTMVNGSLQKHFDITTACSAPFVGEICRGRVFMLDKTNWEDDDFMLAQLVASRLRVELEHHALWVRMEENTASRERMKVARDLHDGILQSLTAAGLQLKTLASISQNKLSGEIENVRKLLFAEQQRIRSFVDGRNATMSQVLVELHNEMERELDEIRRQWGCDVALSVTPKDATISPELGRQLEFMLAEASANAVRHGGASLIDVAIETVPDAIRVRISDNGKGLDEERRVYTHDELDDLNIGPQSLRNRIAELNGSLSLLNLSKGVELRIELPCTLAPQ
jgi:signal transduction histidine kinase